MLKIRTKKADMTIETAAKIILLVLGFTILIFYISKVYLSYNPNDAACQQSVNIRGALPSLGKDYSPLRCKTGLYCIAGDSNGKCEGAYGKDMIGVSTVKVSTKSQIEKFLADKFVSCFTIMGEGKLSLFSQFRAKELGFGFIYPTCVICARIAFDFKSLDKAGINLQELNKLDIEVYMGSHKIPDGDVSYLTYFIKEGGKIAEQKNINLKDLSAKLTELKSQVNSLPQLDDLSSDAIIQDLSAKQLANQQTATLMKTDISKISKADLDKLQQNTEISLVFMQITSPTMSGVLINDAAIVGIGGLTTASSPILSSLASKIGGIILKNPYALAITAVAAIGALTAQTSMVLENRNIAASYCGEFGLGTEARSGCSFIKLIDYNKDSIQKICKDIESI